MFSNQRFREALQGWFREEQSEVRPACNCEVRAEPSANLIAILKSIPGRTASATDPIG